MNSLSKSFVEKYWNLQETFSDKIFFMSDGIGIIGKWKYNRLLGYEEFIIYSKIVIEDDTVTVIGDINNGELMISCLQQKGFKFGHFVYGNT